MRDVHFTDDIRAACQSKIVLAAETARVCRADPTSARLFLSGVISGLKSIILTIGGASLWERAQAEISNSLSVEAADLFEDVTQDTDGPSVLSVRVRPSVSARASGETDVTPG